MARERKLSIAMNVGNDDDLPKSGRNLSEFIRIMEEDHGEFDLDLQLGVNPVVDAGHGNEKVIGFLADYEDEPSLDEEEDEEEDEDDYDDHARKRS